MLSIGVGITLFIIVELLLNGNKRNKKYGTEQLPYPELASD